MDKLVDPTLRPLVLTFRRRKGREIADLWETGRLDALARAWAPTLAKARKTILLRTPMPCADENGSLGAGMLDTGGLRRSPSLSHKSGSSGDLVDFGVAHGGGGGGGGLDAFSGLPFLLPQSGQQRAANPIDTPESYRYPSHTSGSRIFTGPTFVSEARRRRARARARARIEKKTF